MNNNLIKKCGLVVGSAALMLSLASCSHGSSGGNNPPPPPSPKPKPGEASISVAMPNHTLLVPSQTSSTLLLKGSSAPSSVVMTISAKNIHDEMTVSIADEEKDGNKLSFGPQSCTLSQAQSSCSVTVSAEAGDQGQDLLDISAKDNKNARSVSVSPPTETIDFEQPSPPPPPPPQPVTGVTYTLDATAVGGDADHAIAYIKGINQVSYPQASQYFDIKNGALYGKGTPPAGIYQINVKATKGHEIAYNTFYINVTADGSLSAWRQGQAQQSNFIKLSNQPLTMIYTYTHSDPSKPGDSRKQFFSDYTGYAQTLNSHNGEMKGKAPINSVAVEMAGPEYTDDNISWVLDPKVTDIKSQVLQSAPSLANGFDDLSWMPQLTTILSSNGSGLTLSPDLTFGQQVRADYSTYDDEQLTILSNQIMKYAHVSGAPVSGISFDLEKGTGNDDARAFKSIADHLAYHGLFFGYYEFADKSFQPSIVAAMGPLGVAYVSSYDAGTSRATKEEYTREGLDGNALYSNIFAQNDSCDIHNSSTLPDPVKRASWCNLSSNDSYMANVEAWSNTKNPHSISTKQTMDDFNGHYSVTLPIGESSTDFSYLELFNPDFSVLLGKSSVHPGLVMTNNSSAGAAACAVMSRKSLGNFTAKNLDSCLFSNVKFGGHPFSHYAACGKDVDGKDIPLSKCILISSNLSAVGGALKHPTQADYMQQNLKAYTPADPRMIGYSLFALQNTASAPGNGNFLGSDKTNLAIQQPWFIGGNAKQQVCKNSGSAPCDPFYGSSEWQGIVNGVKGAWSEFATIQLPLHD